MLIRGLAVPVVIISIPLGKESNSSKFSYFIGKYIRSVSTVVLAYLGFGSPIVTLGAGVKSGFLKPACMVAFSPSMLSTFIYAPV